MATEVLAPGVVDKRVEQELVRSLKRTYDMFRASGDPTELVDESAAAPARALRLASKIGDEYAPCVGLAPPQAAPASRRSRKEGAASKALASSDSKPGVAKAAATAAATEEAGEDLKKAAEMAARIRDGGAPPAAQQASSALIVVPEAAARQEDDESAAPGRAASASASGVVAKWVPPVLAGKPEWHAPWKLFRVVSGHLGWVRSITVDPSNDWFATGSADRTIKIWDVASGSLRLTLTGHIGTVRGLQVSARHPYLFSCADDKKVLCWDLEYNKVVRHYHGHLSGVYCLSLHPTLDVLATGGRDSAVRVWDVRTKNQIFCLSGHQNTVWSVAAQASEPQIVSGSMDSTIKFWDLAAGKCMTTLTQHKKGVRALATHHTDNAMMSGAADNLKKWRFPMGEFLGNFTGHNAIVNSVAISRDNVVVSGGDNGTLHFWDWKTGYNFQQEQVKPQPGSLESEAGIYAMAFDQSSLRLITCEADKSIKMWKPDDEATPETHPVKNWRQQLKAQRATY